MKLACYKFNGLTLSEETFNMNRFNVARTMRKLIGSMGLMFLGMSIPAIVFKACNYMFTSYDRVADYSSGIMSTFSVSTLLLMSFTRWMCMFLFFIAAFKLIKNGDVKDFGKDVLYIAIGYVLVGVLSLLPVMIPNAMKAMGYL